MPTIDFYIIKQTEETDLLFFACRLIDRIFNQNRHIYINTATQESAKTFSELLWSFRPDSFLPHDLIIDEASENSSITIGFAENYQGHQDVLINLAAEIPSFHTQFQRIAEIVRNDESSKQISREHWRFYQNKGYSLKKNEI